MQSRWTTPSYAGRSEALIFLLGDEESAAHRVSLAILAKVMGKVAPADSVEEARKEADKTGDSAKVPLAILKRLRERLDGTHEKKKKAKEDGEDEEGIRTKALCEVVTAVLSPILRSDEASWEEHVAAVTLAEAKQRAALVLKDAVAKVAALKRVAAGHHIFETLRDQLAEIKKHKQAKDLEGPALAGLIATGTSRRRRFAEEQIILERDGVSLTLRARIATERVDGRVIGYVVTFEDVTDLLTAQPLQAEGHPARLPCEVPELLVATRHQLRQVLRLLDDDDYTGG